MIIANMQVTPWKSWTPRLAAFFMALLVAATLVFWLLRWPRHDSGPALPLASVPDDVALASVKDVAQLLGAGVVASSAVVPVEASSRFHLTGVIASGGGQGVALLAIDGKPTRPYRVGSALEEGLMLQSVEKRRVALASDARAPVSFHLDLPAKQP